VNVANERGTNLRGMTLERIRGAPAISGVDLNLVRLANPRSEEAAVALDANLAAVQQICHCCNGLFGALRARAHSQNQIAKGKLGARSQDKRILFHR
jgi:hypothetical protein